ncbi:VPLPA-CTERM sorting domain-containing protein [Paracoccus actinidiae]|jgi:hypothetical protein|uniref:VPLPA-CTERM sorting domain-containing protein n=1 Tax=Paracoccus actinidiae TaxID=3064531 RepID=UPI0027D22400|nr:VPLPA-CTERM sorting domain-containing protein [Paracoccus sp. M09]
MNTHKLGLAAIATAVAISAAPVAQAATIPFSETITQNFGKNAGHVEPVYGKGGLADNYVTVLDRLDTTGNRFYHEISFGDLVYETISSLTLTLKVADAAYRSAWIFPVEDWRVYGSNNGGTNEQDRSELGSKITGNDWSMTLTSGSVLTQALAAGKMAFWFGDKGGVENDFKLFSASVTIEGQAEAPAPVPLPAAGFLLVGALGGLAAMRRRKAAA